MYDMGLSILEQYGLEATYSYRGRGGLICSTKEGICMIQPVKKEAEQHFLFQNQVLNKIQENNILVDTILLNKEEGIISTNGQGEYYIVKLWYEARECDPRSKEDVLRAVKNMAIVHRQMNGEGARSGRAMDEIMLKHNREMKRIRNYIRKKRQKREFEYLYLETVDEFLRQGEAVYQEILDSRCGNFGMDDICHGDLNQHNILFQNEKIIFVNFDKCRWNTQMDDLYFFMRKILEKNGWNIELARKMIQVYHMEKAISKDEARYLKVCFAYPEKYWKIANHYFNSNKAWICEKNTEKLKILLKQKENWKTFRNSDIFDSFF